MEQPVVMAARDSLEEVSEKIMCTHVDSTAIAWLTKTSATSADIVD